MTRTVKGTWNPLRTVLHLILSLLGLFGDKITKQSLLKSMVSVCHEDHLALDVGSEARGVREAHPIGAFLVPRVLKSVYTLFP